MIFHELTGINVVMMYSNTILESILGTGTSGFTARQGTYLLSIASLLSAFSAIWTVGVFGRKKLLLWGHASIFVTHLLIGVFTIVGLDYGVLVMMCLFLIIFNNTSGPIAWVYAAETCCDISLGICLQVLWGVVLILSLTSTSLMNSALQPQGVFFLFAGFSFIATFFVHFYMDETMGLSEKQKKQLYVPGAVYGRKLRHDEIFQQNDDRNTSRSLFESKSVDPRSFKGISETIESRENTIKDQF